MQSHSHSHSPKAEEIVSAHLPDLHPFEAQYKDFHAHPELSTQESRTAAIAAKHLEELGFTVHRGIGGTGAVGVLENGQGHIVLLRADMDGLPILEESGVDYASTFRMRDADGVEKPTMHACGHDFHVSSLMAVASLLVSAKGEWSGTLICLFQPNEERGGGAQAMVSSGLYDIIPVPDIILGQHVNDQRTGTVLSRSGVSLSAADSFEVTIHGRGGHGSQPQHCIDPIVIASFIIIRIQTIVSRMIAPSAAAVVTCGSIHGGDAENIIPDKVIFKLNVRSYNPQVRERIIKALHQIIESECESAGTLQKPTIKQITQFPLTVSDPDISSTLASAFKSFFGDNYTEMDVPMDASEDFSNLARPPHDTPHEVPYAFWFFGGTDAGEWDEAERKGDFSSIPKNHMSKYAPVVQPTLRTGIQAFALAALNFLIS